MSESWTQKAAELICVGVRHTTLDDEALRLIDRGVSGVLVYETKFAGPVEAFELIRSIKERAGRPIFVAIDHEGGDRCRLQRGFTRFPPLRELGLTADPAYAHEVGRVLGRELRAVGVDVCLGPVLDVATNPKNPVIGERSLGGDAALVAEMGTELARGLQREGVAACGKHFPGHGDTITDSNEHLPVLPHGVSRLDEVELKPFIGAVDARIAALLVGHILFRALDPRFPASLSRPILFGLLRQRRAYRGAVFTDDVDMGALSLHFSAAEIAERGIAAGADCFLCARHPETAHALIDAIAQGIERGTVLPERVEAARRRIGALIHRYVPAKTEFHPELVGTPENAAVLARINE